MNSIEGSQTIPMFVDLKNTLVKVKTLRFINLKVELGMESSVPPTHAPNLHVRT